MRILLKLGGALLESGDSRADLAAAIAAARADGHEVVVVHGGGNQIRALSRRLGLADGYVDGLRVTDAETAELVLMVVAGAVGKSLVAALEAGGVPAVGLCGADGGLYEVRPHPTPGLGYVGLVTRARTELADALLAAGYVPVVACLGPLAPEHDGPSDRLYNVNADDVALALAGAFAADALLFLTDVPGVLDAAGGLVPSLDAESADRLAREGVLAGGILPKVRAGLAAAEALPGALVKIASAGGRDALRAALAPSAGTTFLSPTSSPAAAGPARR